MGTCHILALYEGDNSDNRSDVCIEGVLCLIWFDLI